MSVQFNDGTIPGLPGGPKSTDTETFKVDPSALPEEAKKEAWQAIMKAYDIHYRKDTGIMALEAQVERARDTVSEIVHKLVYLAVRIAGNSLPVAHGVFLAIKKYAEQEMRKKDKLENNRELPMGELLPAWARACSIAGRSLAARIDPNTVDPVSGQPVFDTLNKYAEASKPTTPDASQGKGKKGTVLQIVASGLTPKLASSMQILSENLGRLSNPEQDTEASFVEKFANGVAERHAAYVKANPAPAPAAVSGPGAEPAAKPEESVPETAGQKRQAAKRGGSR